MLTVGRKWHKEKDNSWHYNLEVKRQKYEDFFFSTDIKMSLKVQHVQILWETLTSRLTEFTS